MKVVLIKDIKRLGNLGSVVSVSRGFGRHYLIANKFALYATDQNLKRVSEQLKALESKHKLADTEFVKIVQLIENLKINFVMQASKDGKLFGSVNAKKIANEIFKTTGQKISHVNVDLSEPIKYTGIYETDIVFSEIVKTKIFVVVGESETQIEKLLASLKLDSADKATKLDEVEPADVKPVNAESEDVTLDSAQIGDARSDAIIKTSDVKLDETSSDIVQQLDNAESDKIKLASAKLNDEEK